MEEIFEVGNPSAQQSVISETTACLQSRNLKLDARTDRHLFALKIIIFF